MCNVANNIFLYFGCDYMMCYFPCVEDITFQHLLLKVRHGKHVQNCMLCHFLNMDGETLEENPFFQLYFSTWAHV
jgi:hypothetical protein